MKDYTSTFPDKIDNLIFFQDVSIDKLPIMDHYNLLIESGNYSMASAYINGEDISFYGAWLLNMLEERLIVIEDYIMHQLEKPDLVTYSDNEPTDKEIWYCWT